MMPEGFSDEEVADDNYHQWQIERSDHMEQLESECLLVVLRSSCLYMKINRTSMEYKMKQHLPVDLPLWINIDEMVALIQ